MPALWLWWNLLPVPVRRLLGAFLVLAGVAGLAALAVHHERNVGYAAGYRRAADSVWKREMQHRQVVQDSLEIVAARSAQTARDGTTVLVPQRAKFDSATALRHTPRIEPLAVPVGLDTSLVSVIVESTNEHFILPRGAAREWFVSDSLVGVARQLLDKYAAANKRGASAWQDEHAAREGADSLVAMYTERLRGIGVAPAAHSHRLVYVALGIAAGFIAAKHIR